MFEQIYNHPSRRVVNRRLCNLQLCMKTEDCVVDVLWLRVINVLAESDELPNVRENQAKEGELHKHIFYESHLIMRGYQAYTTEDGTLYRLEPGDALLLPPNVLHGSSYVSTDMCKISFAFDVREREGNQRSMLRHSFPKMPAVFSDTSEIASIILKIMDEIAAQKLLYVEAARMLAYRAALSFARMTKQSKTIEDESTLEHIADGRVIEIVQYIEKHLAEGIGAQDVANCVHLSVRQINRILKQEFAMNVGELISRKKAYEAERLLIFTDKSVDEIAEMLGFSNGSSFRKFYKRVGGMPPGLFRSSRYKQI